MKSCRRFVKDEYGRPRPAIGGYLTFILGTGVNLNYLRENHMAIVAIHDSQYAYYGSSEVETPLNSLGLSNALSNINTEITKEIESQKFKIEEYFSVLDNFKYFTKFI